MLGLGFGGLGSMGLGAGGAPAPPNPTYLPTVSASPSFVVGTSKLISAYAGAAGRTQRISDDVEADVAFGTKFADVSGIGLGTHNWKTLYDQTGNGNHITQATKANQPAASNLKYAGCPAVHFDSSDLAVGVTSKNMVCATGPATEKSAFTSFFLLAPTHSFNDNYYFRQPHTATTLSLFTQTTNVGVRGNNSSPFNSTRKMPRAQPHVLRWRGSAAGKQFAVNGSTQLLSTAPTAGPETGIAVGSHSSTASFDGKFDLIAIVIYNAALSDADCLLVETALYAQCNVLTSASNLVIFDGDSRTQGAGRTLNETWVKKYLSSTGKSIHAVNMGVGGQTLSTMATNVAARVAALYDAAYTKNIVVMGGPAINDFTANQTAAQAQTSIQTYASGLNANQTLVVATVPLRDTSTAPQNQARIDYNTWLKANYASLKTGTVLVDLDGISQFQAWSSTYWIDIVHFNDAGQQLWAAAFAPTIDALLA
ncbi:SGNH/GDSL hydrolase family protein [Mesorhizobium sp. M4B.F.Ca.ET.143.01.1.1]|uniref:SGNH/GDSL hydrolase family protein n=1 Tax=Mesorhizobium sp. M4B.F.Ca.ET.143.01.1.1 TaxID=2563947 RepID=UPI00109350D0|nr:SGNH/GDSL hydrolase family protein [Mesorhizobium sp. M4B.F.Ca.ET.143.01.1.1]TGV26341.1 SGNH/GDSL hydrolase family protein [Mesorhizobium sp. M4B.F.Ca.ET.143.01.1.1]